MADDAAAGPGDTPMPEAGAGDDPPAAKAEAAPEPEPEPEAEATAAAGAAEAAEEMVEPEVPPVALGSLQDMGFSRNKAVRALHGSGGGVDQAIAWLEEHEGDADLEEPLRVPKSSIKPKLTPEEAKAAGEEMVRKAKKRREAEEAKLDKKREAQRIEMGKHIQAAQRLEEQEALRKNVEFRKREKKEDAKAREKIRQRLEEDRKERRRKLGLPEEETEEEKAARLERDRVRAEAEAAKQKNVNRPMTVPVTAQTKLRECLVAMKKQYGDDPGLTVCFQTLMKLVGNVAKDPTQEKYRQIRASNAAIQQRVLKWAGAADFLRVVGFAEDGEFLKMPEAAADRAVLTVAGAELNNALTNPFFGKL